MRFDYIRYLLVCTWLLLFTGVAVSAKNDMPELEESKIYFEHAPSLKVAMLEIDSPESVPLVKLLPYDANAAEAYAVKAADGNEFSLAVGIEAGVSSASNPFERRTTLVVRASDKTAEVVCPAAEFFPENAGTVNKISVWPLETTQGTGLVVIFTLTMVDRFDSPVLAFVLFPEGQVARIDTTNAMSLYGDYRVTDLDGNNHYELVTYRNLDSTGYGFYYQAVREFDPENLEYQPAPGNYRAFYARELELMEWIVETRREIERNPDKFINTSGQGAFYVAEHEGRIYSFDTIVPYPEGNATSAAIGEYNLAIRENFARIVAYRDDLRSWLEGGAVPEIWQLGSPVLSHDQTTD
jgi:hypothetical protein